MTDNPHFETVRSWKAAEALLKFRPMRLRGLTGDSLQLLRVHVRDHKMRVIELNARTLEAHYGGFILSQSQKGAEEARRLALRVSYGAEARDVDIAGHHAKVYERGPEVPSDDIDGHSPAVVAWADGDMFFLIASSTVEAAELRQIAVSIYQKGGERSGRIRQRTQKPRTAT